MRQARGDPQENTHVMQLRSSIILQTYTKLWAT